MFINYMDDRIHLAYGFVIDYLDAVSFTNFTCTCKDLLEYNTSFNWNRLWKKGRVPNVKTAYYVQHKLRLYRNLEKFVYNSNYFGELLENNYKFDEIC